MKCSDEWLGQKTKNKAKFAYEICESIEVAEAKDDADLEERISNTKWIKESDVLGLLVEREKELREKYAWQKKIYKIPTIAINEVLGDSEKASQ